MFQHFLNEFSIKLSYQPLCVKELFSCLLQKTPFCKTPFWKTLLSELTKETLLPAAFEKAYTQHAAILLLKEEDVSLLTSLFYEIGNSDLESQMKTLSFYQARIEESLTTAREEEKRLSHLYLTLGIATSAGLALLFW